MFSAMRVRSSAIIAVLSVLLLLVCDPLLCFGSRTTLSVNESESAEAVVVVEEEEEEEGIVNATGTAAESNASRRSNEDSLAGMIDRALQREFPENEQNEGSVLRSIAYLLLVVELGFWILFFLKMLLNFDS